MPNFLTEKTGPLPTYGWLAIFTGLALVFYMYQKKKKSSSATSTAANAQSAEQLLAAEEAAAAGVAGQTTPNYNYGNGMSRGKSYSQKPAVSSTTPVGTTAPVGTTPAAPAATAPAPVATTAPAATTISGSPGSYTTGLAGNLDEWTSTGAYSLNTLASSHGMTTQQLITASEGAQNNVLLKNYVAKGNYNSPLPAGVELFYPAQYWATK